MTTTRDILITEMILEDHVSSPAARVSSSVEKMDDGFSRLKRGASGLSPQLGGLANDMGDLLAAIGPAGAAVGVTVAVVGLIAAMGKLSIAADDNAAKLQKLGLITEEQAQRIDQSSDAVRAMGAAWEAFGATLASIVSPIVDRVFTSLTFLLLVLQDALDGNIRTFDEYAIAIGQLKLAVEDTGKAVHKDAVEPVAALGFQLSVTADAYDALTAKVIENNAKIGDSMKNTAQGNALVWLDAFATITDSAQQMAEGHIAVQKVLQAVNIALSGAAAGWQVFAQGGLYTLPAAIATWAASAASAGWALSQAFAAPTKHPTPNIPGTGSRREARQDRREDRREERQDRRADRDGGTATAVVQWRHQIYDTMTRDALRRDSPLTRSMSRNGNRSH